jgi:glycosyltransferase involved in cell wall biosynthesis
MLVGVCDFPSKYEFPPRGYGGIERWLWATAVGARRSGCEVHLLGPLWRADLRAEWEVRPIRLEDGGETGTSGLPEYDLLVVGHEYVSLPAWREVFDQMDADLAAFQHWPHFTHRPGAFDGHRVRLYCYSDEMVDRYADCRPIKELAVHLGLDEEEKPAMEGGGLLWLGRVDAEKAPHVGIMAAQILGRPITILGPVFDPSYVDRHRSIFRSSNVRMAGEVGGRAKSEALRRAAALVYTTGRSYVEAGAAIFGEALRAGTPVAALGWKSGTCADAALCPDTGRVARVDPVVDDQQAAEALAEAIETATHLRAGAVQEIGMARFDPERHFTALASRV